MTPGNQKEDIQRRSNRNTSSLIKNALVKYRTLSKTFSFSGGWETQLGLSW